MKNYEEKSSKDITQKEVSTKDYEKIYNHIYNELNMKKNSLIDNQFSTFIHNDELIIYQLQMIDGEQKINIIATQKIDKKLFKENIPSEHISVAGIIPNVQIKEFTSDNFPFEFSHRKKGESYPKKLTIEEQSFMDNTPVVELVLKSERKRDFLSYMELNDEDLKKHNRELIQLTEERLDDYSEKMLDIVSANVKKYRMEKGLSQMDLALDIGLKSGAYLGRAELRKPKHHFNIKHIAKISKVLDIPICKFFEE